jgi:hypothetical protein
MLNSIQFSNKSNSYSMKTFKLGFGNRTVLEQISICRRVADGIAKLTAEQRATFADRPVADSVAEATEAHAAVEELKASLKAALRVRDAKVRVMRQHTTGAASGISALTGGNVAAMLGAGLGVAKEKHPVGKPDAPGNLRVAATDFEGRVRLALETSHPPLRLPHRDDHRSGGGDGLAAGGHQRQPSVLRSDRTGERGEVLVPRGRHQRARPGPVESGGQCAGEVRKFNS